jgi:hypothetical protein
MTNQPNAKQVAEELIRLPALQNLRALEIYS